MGYNDSMTAWMARFLKVLLIVALVVTTAAVVSIPFLLRFRRAQLSIATEMSRSGSVPSDGLPVDSARVVAALDSAIDPEVGYSVVELGLVHSVAIDSGPDVRVVLALTTPECPYGYALGDAVLTALSRVPGIREIRVKLDPHIAWNPDLMTGRARERYGKLFRFGHTRR
jgi:metal-sulfur cluster biosynthetic enzyme